MCEFFRGWKRKVGVLTLLMGCAVTGSWIGSMDFCSRFGFPIREGLYWDFATLSFTLTLLSAYLLLSSAGQSQSDARA